MARRGTRVPDDQLAAERAELAAYREALAHLERVLDATVRGDLEARVAPLAGPPVLARVRDRFNSTLDAIDAFVRESGASLAAAADGHFYRQFMVRGMPGTFREGAVVINGARRSMQDGAAELDAQGATRAVLVGRMIEVSTHVAAASTELGASAGSLAESAGTGVTEADKALGIVHELERSSQEIQQAVTLIKQVTTRTRLLALNATIEAARAGTAGRGFAVVAAEVKALADEAARSSDDITAQVRAAQAATEAAVDAIGRVSSSIHEMNAQVDGIAVASGGSQGGLSHMAEELREEIEQFAQAV